MLYTVLTTNTIKEGVMIKKLDIKLVNHSWDKHVILIIFDVSVVDIYNVDTQ